MAIVIVSDPKASKLYAGTLRDSCDGDVKWTLYPDTGRLQTFTRACRGPELYDWFLTHTRQ